MNFSKILPILTRIPGKQFKVLQNSGIPQDFELARFGILQKLSLSFLEILKFLGAQFSVIHRGDIFWNSPIQLFFEESSLFFRCEFITKAAQD